MRLIVLIAILALASFSFAGVLPGPTVSSCGVINAPGTYTLTSSLSTDINGGITPYAWNGTNYLRSTCILINSTQNVVFNCAGNYINTSDNPHYAATGVTVQYSSNVTIENCIVNGNVNNLTTPTGIDLFDVNNSFVKFNSVVNYHFGGGSMLALSDDDADYGPFVSNNSNNLFLNNTAIDVSSLITSHAQGSQYINNTMTTGPGLFVGVGMLFGFGVNNTVVEGNTLSTQSPGELGMQMYSPFGAGWSNNTVVGNRFSGDFGTDFDLEGSTNENVSNNIAVNTSREGFVLYIEHHDTVYNNTAENDSYGFVLDNGGNGHNNVSDNNATFNKNNGFMFLEDEGSDSVDGNYAGNNGLNGFFLNGTSYSVFNNNLAINNTADGFFLTHFIGHDLYDNLTNNIAINNSLYGFELDSINNILLMDDNATNNTYGGFYLQNTAAGNNLTGDLASDNLGAGFYLEDASNNTLTHDNSSDNLGDGYGDVNSGAYNNVTDSIAVNNSNGFDLRTENHDLLARDDAFNNANYGFNVDGGSTYNLLTGDNASFNGINGFELFSSSDNVINNSIAFDQTGTGDDGFLDVGHGTSDNNLTNDVAYLNFQGFEIQREDGDYLASNSAHDNYYAGFMIDQQSFNNLLVNNNANNDSNTRAGCSPYSGGFVIASSKSNTLINSTSTNNYVNCAPDSIDSISGNNGNGFVLTDTQFSATRDNLINGATTYGNGFCGVYETESQSYGLSTDNNLSNAQSYNNLYGIYLNRDDSDYLDNVTAFNNNVAGFYESGYSSNYNANINNSWFYNNPWEIIQQSDNQEEFIVNNTRLGQTPYVRFFLDDYVQGGGYEIKETTVPGALPSGMSSFGGKYLKVNFTGELSIDEIGYIWSQAEASAGGITNSSKIGVYTWNDSGWNLTAPQTMDLSNSSMYTITTGSHDSQIIVNITSDDVYALIYNGTLMTPPSTGGNPPVNNGYLVMSKQAVCPGNLLNVTVSTSGNSPAAGASVTVYDNGVPVAAGSTGPDGSVSLTLNKTDNSYTVNATYGSYPAIGQGFSYALCAGTPACSSDNDCPVDQRCQVNDNPSLNKCVPVQCQCGQSVQNHTCVGQVYQCGSGQNCNACPNGQICGDNHQCKPGCTSDASCKDNEACRTATGAPGTTTTPGACQPLCPDGSSSCSCSQATNHTLVPYGYECGSEPGCQQCQPGFTCNSDHKCVQGDINCPPTAVVGDQKNCNVTQNNQPLSNCSVTVTDPSGKTYTESCDPSGTLQTPPLTIAGVWTVTLLQNGTAVKTVQINALPKSAPAEQPTPTAAPGFDLGSLVWLLVLLVIIIAAILYWRSRGSKR